MKSWHFLGAATLAAMLAACGGDDSNDNNSTNETGDPVAEVTPASIKLAFSGRYQAGSFDASAAEIPAYDAASQRLFVVNAEAGELDVLDLSDPSAPVKLSSINVSAIAAGAEVNSVAVKNGLVAVAIEADPKTDNGFVALYQADDLTLLGSTEVGPQPDMITFTPDGMTVLTANEGEPSDDYSVDPEGSISIINVTDTGSPVVTHADFAGFNAADLREAGVRIYGPGASAAQDLEPETRQGSLPAFETLPRYGRVVMIGDFLSPLEEIRESISALANQGIRGHLVQVLDPAEETLPFSGRVRFDGMEDEGDVLIGRVESMRDDYLQAFNRHNQGLEALAKSFGWSYAIHHTDHSPETPLLALYLVLSEKTGD